MTNPKKLRSCRRRRRRRKAAKKILQQNNILQVLTSHIIPDITLRLPIKSIVHCMRVCKTWRNIILQPDFADLHLSTSLRSADDIFLCYIKEDSQIFTLVPIESPVIAHENLLVFATPKHTPVLYRECTTFFLDDESANGLICLRPERTLYIYNPIIKEYAIIPSPTNCSEEDFDVFAFGFCPKSSQYKLLRAVSYTTKVEKPKRCEIYTLGTPAWREVCNTRRWRSQVDELDEWLFFGDCIFNGAVHFLAERKNKGNVIVCFDLEIEEFVPFPQPPVDGNDLKHLGVLDNCLIATCSTDDNMDYGILEVWVMQEYMREDSWTKKWEIDYSELVDWDRFDKDDGYYEPSFEDLEPIKLLSDGRLVVSYLNQVYFYDPEEKRLKKSELPNKSWFLHTPTFVSPKKVMGQISSNDNEITKDPTSKQMRLC